MRFFVRAREVVSSVLIIVTYFNLVAAFLDALDATLAHSTRKISLSMKGWWGGVRVTRK
jgi:hypothetical protein